MTFTVTKLTPGGPDVVLESPVLQDALNCARLAILSGAISVTIRDADQSVSVVRGQRG